MATKEQLEVWAAEAANTLSDKIGVNAQVIVMTMDANGTFWMERRGYAAAQLFLLETGYKIAKDQILPASTISRAGDARS
jgi:hypothetical protein